MRTLMWCIGTVLLLAGLSVPLGAGAQGGTLTADQLALLDRVKAARENYLAYASLVESVYGSDSQTLTITLGDNQQSFSTATGWERSAQIIRQAEGQNIAAMASASILNANSGAAAEDLSQTVTLNVEFRLVDGQMYVLAAYGAEIPAEAESLELPEGWFVVERLEDWPILDQLELRDLVEQRSVFDDLETMKDAVADVMVSPGVLEDGTDADAVTITLDAAGIRQLLSLDQPADPALTGILGALSPDSGATLTVLLDAENNPHEAISEMMLHAIDLDAGAFGISDLPAGTTIEFTAVLTRRETISQINEPLEPAIAPDELTE